MNMESKGAWIFQGNQKMWDLNSYLKRNYEKKTTAYFTVKNPKHQINEGDDAYIWRATVEAGMVALGEVVLRPTPQKDIPDLSAHIHKPDPYKEDGNTLKVGVRLRAVHINKSDNYYPREEFKRNRVFSSFDIVTVNTGTVFYLEEYQADFLRVKLNKRWELKSLKRGILEDNNELNYPDEIEDQTSLTEGAKKQVTINAYERNPAARSKCLDHYGYKCTTCEFDFEKTYGELGKGYIHVHHLVDISSVGKEYTIDPIKDLRPVCPNCHAMLHRNTKISRSIEDLKGKIQEFQCG